MNIPEKFQHKFTSEDINALPLTRFGGHILLVTRQEQMDEAMGLLKGESLLGFDTETKPSFKKGVSHPPALIQLATSSSVILFQLGRTGYPQALSEIFADPCVIKAGVAVHDDIKGLNTFSPFNPAGFADLGDISRSLELPTNGLRNMAANLMGVRISKGATRSNWGQRVLTKRQISYPPTDA